jgi:hypothetical protein
MKKYGSFLIALLLLCSCNRHQFGLSYARLEVKPAETAFIKLSASAPDKQANAIAQNDASKLMVKKPAPTLIVKRTPLLIKTPSIGKIVLLRSASVSVKKIIAKPNTQIVSPDTQVSPLSFVSFSLGLAAFAMFIISLAATSSIGLLFLLFSILAAISAIILGIMGIAGKGRLKGLGYTGLIIGAFTIGAIAGIILLLALSL